MSAHVLLNLLNELRNKDKMRGARMLNSIYHMTLKLLKFDFWRDKVKMWSSFT